MATQAPAYPAPPTEVQPANGAPATAAPADGLPSPRKRGRPKGSKNKATLALEAAGVIKDKRPAVPRPPRNPDAPKRPVGRPRKERGEWIELAATRPDDFLHLLLTTLDVPTYSNTAGSLEDAFKSHLGSLSQQASSSTPAQQAIPSLYSILKTFWLPSSPAYFSLTSSAGSGSARVPSSHRFLYWDPLPLVFNGISCPTCAAPLTHRGRIRSGPLTIHDLNGPFFVIGCIYACEPGNHVFASTDASVRAALPELLEREFPARLIAGDSGAAADVWSWQARGVSRALWNLVMGGIASGLSKELILQLVRAVQHGVPEQPKPLPGPVAPAATDPAPKKEEEEEDEEEEDEMEQENDALGEDEAANATQQQQQQQLPQSPAILIPPPAATQAFNDAWTANSGTMSPMSSTLPSNPYRPITAMPYYQGLMIPYDPNNASTSGAQGRTLKRAYPFEDGQQQPQPIHTASFDSPPPAASISAAPPMPMHIVHVNSPGPKPRAPRHCCKCGSQTCKGKGGRHFCPNPCMDCGKMDCRGRNSRRPDRRCDNMGVGVGVGGAAAPASAAAAGVGVGVAGGAANGPGHSSEMHMQMPMAVDPSLS
ncbi:hypothetical protein HMN09_00456500 [Mycena chlorophos]|uniref:Uncharacterized protein n=1 Tax=Mycena chlorophos TaxID=658473 RepID=A0A8H6TK74_MYCCL|nr:hypothetical protein HMN09_00456500 [Mycena chlorophos]